MLLSHDTEKQVQSQINQCTSADQGISWQNKDAKTAAWQTKNPQNEQLTARILTIRLTQA